MNVRKILQSLRLGDQEILVAEFRGPYPLVFWITALEPNQRRGLGKVLPWRIRTALATLLHQRFWSRCTKCDQPFTFGELLARNGSLSLQYFPSGSICHNTCTPSASFLEMVERMKTGQPLNREARG